MSPDERWYVLTIWPLLWVLFGAMMVLCWRHYELLHAVHHAVWHVQPFRQGYL